MDKIADFILQVEKLKNENRRGWKLRGIKNPESVAEHSFMVAFISMLLNEKLNGKKVIQLALVHDIAESICGDITPWDKNAARKRKIETAAMKKLTSNLPKKLKTKILALWKEYEFGKSKEARFVREIDRLEVFFQAFEYERGKKGAKNLFEKFPIWKSEIKNKKLLKMYELLNKKRKRKNRNFKN